MKAFFVLIPLFFGSVSFGYSNCFDHVRQFIQEKTPRSQARIADICKKTDAMVIICGLDFRQELPSLMRTPETFEMAIDTCQNESENVVMCTRSALFKGPRSAEPIALKQAVKSCYE